MDKRNILVGLGGLVAGMVLQMMLMSGNHDAGVAAGELSMCNKLIPLAFQSGFAGLMGIKCVPGKDGIIVTSTLTPERKLQLKELTDMIDKANGRN